MQHTISIHRLTHATYYLNTPTHTCNILSQYTDSHMQHTISIHRLTHATYYLNTPTHTCNILSQYTNSRMQHTISIHRLTHATYYLNTPTHACNILSQYTDSRMCTGPARTRCQGCKNIQDGTLNTSSNSAFGLTVTDLEWSVNSSIAGLQPQKSSCVSRNFLVLRNKSWGRTVSGAQHLIESSSDNVERATARNSCHFTAVILKVTGLGYHGAIPTIQCSGQKMGCV